MGRLLNPNARWPVTVGDFLGCDEDCREQREEDVKCAYLKAGWHGSCATFSARDSQAEDIRWVSWNDPTPEKASEPGTVVGLLQREVGLFQQLYRTSYNRSVQR
jgi:hypothetical protein